MDGTLKIFCKGKDQYPADRLYTISIPMTFTSDDNCLETRDGVLDFASIEGMRLDVIDWAKLNHYKCAACGREWDAKDAFYCKLEINEKVISHRATICPECKECYGF